MFGALKLLLAFGGVAGTTWWADQELNNGKGTDAVLGSLGDGVDRTTRRLAEQGNRVTQGAFEGLLEGMNIDPESPFGYAISQNWGKVLALGALAASPLPKFLKQPLMGIALGAIVIMGLFDFIKMSKSFNGAAQGRDIEIAPQQYAALPSADLNANFAANGALPADAISFSSADIKATPIRTDVIGEGIDLDHPNFVMQGGNITTGDPDYDPDAPALDLDQA